MSQFIGIRLNIGRGLDFFSDDSSFHDNRLESLAFQGLRSKSNVTGVLALLLLIGIDRSSLLALRVGFKTLLVIVRCLL
jgi:hypothetical protein